MDTESRRQMTKLTSGSPFTLGATPDDKGTNFALFSDHAEGVTLCLFSKDGKKETERIDLQECTNGVWHGHVAGVKAGPALWLSRARPVRSRQRPPLQRRQAAARPLCPRTGRRRSIWDDALYGYTVGGGDDADLDKDERDSAHLHAEGARHRSPKPLTKSQRPMTPWPQTVIYESHVRGWTMRHRFCPDDIRGTFAAIGHPEGDRASAPARRHRRSS